MPKGKLPSDQQTNNLLVVQHNDLIEASYRMSLVAKRTLMFLMAKIDARKPFPNTIHLDANEYSEWAETEKRHSYSDMQKGAEELMRTIIKTHDQKTQWTEQTVLVDMLRYHKGEGRIECSFSKWIQPYIYALNKNFTQYALADAGKFKSFYTIRLYEMLMQWKSTGERLMTVEAYREMLGLKPGQYRLMADLRRRTIDIAIKEIKEKTNWYIEIKYNRKGRVIHSLLFTFRQEEQIDMFK
jgi:plasmid replication initiation protein